MWVLRLSNSGDFPSLTWIGNALSQTESVNSPEGLLVSWLLLEDQGITRCVCVWGSWHRFSLCTNSILFWILRTCLQWFMPYSPPAWNTVTYSKWDCPWRVPEATASPEYSGMGRFWYLSMYSNNPALQTALASSRLLAIIHGPVIS